MFRCTLPIVLGLSILLAASEIYAQGDPIETQVKTDKSAAASQQRIDRLDDATSEAFQQYRAAVVRAESLAIYNKQLGRLINSQTQEIASIQRQTEEIESIEIGALPFMIEMTNTLSKLVDGDVPFLRDERLTRIEKLKALIDRADVTAGEKYRRIMEAYLVEAEYGRTIEAYRGELEKNGDVLTVDFLRFGRIGFYYQTLDGNMTGRWNPASQLWEALGGEFRRSVRDGLRMARKQAPPSLLTLPINSPEAS